MKLFLPVLLLLFLPLKADAPTPLARAWGKPYAELSAVELEALRNHYRRRGPVLWIAKGCFGV